VVHGFLPNAPDRSIRCCECSGSEYFGLLGKLPLTTTHFAILGWLAVQPWPIYELAQQTRRNLKFFWPRADSRIYQEPKELVARGLARVERTFVGKRPRTIYSITPKGRRALSDWLGQPSAPPVLEMESLVRVFFADAGTRAQLEATLAGADRLSDEIREVGLTVAREFLDGTHAAPQRMHLSGLLFDFLWSFAEMLEAWSARSHAEVARWRKLSRADGERHARAVFERARRAPRGSGSSASRPRGGSGGSRPPRKRP
jgi:DNA-binding PadR family transcriptional regulator